MHYMIHPDFGIHPMQDTALDEAKAAGWKPIDIQAHIAAKRAKQAVEIPSDSATIEAPAAPRRGRPRKEG